MPKQNKTIEELRRELEAREAELAPLQSKRDKLAKKLSALDKRIAALAGKSKRGRKSGKKTGTAKAAKPTRRRGRRSGQKPLAEYALEVLKNKKDGMGIRAIAEAVQQAGYKTTSKNFPAVVTLLLTKDKRFAKVSRGVYKLA